MRRVLVCGCGSIGRRHIRNLRLLYRQEVEILAWRSGQYADEGDQFAKEHGLREFGRLEDALAAAPTAVFVTNPTIMHLATACAAAERGCHIFIEKPLSHSAEGIERLTSLVSRKNLHAVVGYCLRYHPLLQETHKLIAAGRLGRIFCMDIYCGSYLPAAHPWRDYRRIFRGARELGGGVSREFSHEIDYALWLGGRPISVSGYVARSGSLDITAEDIMEARLRLSNGVLARVHTNFLDSAGGRRMTIVAERGTLTLDLNEGKGRIALQGHMASELDYSGWDRNQMYLDELQKFFTDIDGGMPSAVSLEESRLVVEVIDALEESARSNERAVNIE